MKKFWPVFIVLSVTVICLLMPFPIRGPQASPLANLAHAPTFAILVFVVLLTISRSNMSGSVSCKSETSLIFSMGWRWVLAVAFTLSLFGIGMEFAQRHFGRNGAWSDVLLNTLGLAAGICLFGAHCSGQRGGTRWQALTLGLAGLCLLLAASTQPVYELWLICRDNSH
jgi:hypothetical protein